MEKIVSIGNSFLLTPSPPTFAGPSLAEDQRIFHRMRNALQSLSNCAFLLAREDGLIERHALSAQLQAEVATLSILVRQMETRPVETKEEDGITPRRTT
ncbi:MAG TPA: hypothetical protein VN577_17040 [Terriglobales bacterium]|nr:hypothetical protein [Terriglobales bacterium]